MIQQLLTLLSGFLGSKATIDPGTEESVRALAEALVQIREWERNPSEAQRAKVVEVLENLPLGTLETTLRKWGAAGEEQWKQVLELRRTWLETPQGATVNDATPTLIDGLAGLVDIGSAQSATVTKKGWVKWALYIAPLIAAFFLGDYLREENTLELESEQVIWPRDAYTVGQSDTSLVLTENYKQQYQDQFPDWYFRTDPSLENWFVLKNEAGFSGPAVELKWIFKNRSENFMQLLSTVQISAELIEAIPYPWESLRVESGFEIQLAEQGELKLRNTGNTPILNLNVVVNGEQDFYKDTLIRGLLDSEYWDLKAHAPKGWHAARLNPETGEMRDAVYHKLPPNTHTSKETIEIDYDYYIEEYNLDKLREMTEVIGASWQVHMYWKDLHGRPDSNLITIEQPDLIYFRTNDTILASIPWETNEMPSHEIEAITRYNTAQAAYNLLNEEQVESHPAGVNSWTGHLNLDWNKAPGDLPATVMIHPDIPLNPSGFAILYFRLENPQNGRYRIQLKSNDRLIRSMEVETMVPDEFKFIYPKSLKYFEVGSSD